MPSGLPSVAGVVAIWGVAAAMLWWSRLSGAWRRGLSVLASAAGLAFLLLAVNTEGQREARTVTYLVGTPYETGMASASASLPFYLLTAVCLLLGTAGLAVGDELAELLSRRWLLTAILLSCGVTAVRFGLEKVAAPRSVTAAVGVTWLAPVAGAYFLASLRAEGKGWRELPKAILAYGLAVRGAVAGLMVVATVLRVGSHYDVSRLVHVRVPFGEHLYEFEPGSLRQVLELAVGPQLVLWTAYTMLAGLLGAWLYALAVKALPEPQGRTQLGLAAPEDQKA